MDWFSWENPQETMFFSIWSPVNCTYQSIGDCCDQRALEKQRIVVHPRSSQTTAPPCFHQTRGRCCFRVVSFCLFVVRFFALNGISSQHREDPGEGLESSDWGIWTSIHLVARGRIVVGHRYEHTERLKRDMLPAGPVSFSRFPS